MTSFYLQRLNQCFSLSLQEHFYCGEKNSGFIAWRLRTMGRKTKSPRKRVQAAPAPQPQGPKRQRSAAAGSSQQLDGDAAREAVSFLVHSTDEATVFEKMKKTFQHRQDLVRDPLRSADVFKTYPRFLDVKGLVSFPFVVNASVFY